MGMHTRNGDSKDGEMSPLATAIGVAILAMLGAPVVYYVNLMESMSDHYNVFLIGIGIAFISVPILGYIVMSRAAVTGEPFFYVFTVFAFTAIVDLVLGFCIDDHVNWMDFYLKEGEPYLRGSHGAVINYYDGTVHYALYVLMVYFMASKVDYRATGFFWFGSIFNSMIVLLDGGVAGKFGKQVRASFFLNTPYALCPVIFAFQLWRRPRTKHSPTAAHKKEAKLPLYLRPMDAFFALFLVFAQLVFLLRAHVVAGCPKESALKWLEEVEPYLSDPSKFPFWQAMTWAFYGVPLAVAIMVGLNHPAGRPWVRDAVAAYAGMALQSGVSFAFGAALPNIRYPEPKWQPLPAEGAGLFWFTNLSLTFIPLVMAYRYCYQRPQLFDVPPPKKQD